MSTSSQSIALQSLKKCAWMPVLALLLASGPASAATIYKTVDADGNIVYTDIAPKERDEAQQNRIEIAPSNTYVAPKPPQPGAETSSGSDQAVAKTISYASLEIISPEHDQSIRQNNGNVRISVNAEPALQTGHRVELLLDGQAHVAADEDVINEADGTTLANVDRGTHTVVAQILDAQNNVLIQSPAVTFHLLRISVLTRP